MNAMPAGEAIFVLVYFGVMLISMTVAVGCVVFIFAAAVFGFDDRYRAVDRISDAIQGHLHWLFASTMVWMAVGCIAWLTIWPTNIRLTIG